ncbi:hypothetical protein P9112_009162 [Eukaryota sp. TZLM1-RC]
MYSYNTGHVYAETQPLIGCGERSTYLTSDVVGNYKETLEPTLETCVSINSKPNQQDPCLQHSEGLYPNVEVQSPIVIPQQDPDGDDLTGSIVLSLFGLFFPPLWLLLLQYLSSNNRVARTLGQMSLVCFVIVLFVMFSFLFFAMEYT